jgi:peptidoglycan/xylan/chitin deacetylase (PgdA/CDA1 family)
VRRAVDRIAGTLRWKARAGVGRLREKIESDGRRVVRRVDVGRDPVVALSFDDGPSDVHTALVLDLLAEHGAGATFFVVGGEIAGREHVLRRMVAEGHEIGNHTWSHPAASRVSDAVLRGEIARTNAEIESAVGVRPQLMRPPYFDDPVRTARAAAATGVARTALGMMSRDWVDTSPESIAERVLRRARPGRIIVLHDACPRSGSRGHGDPSITVRALALILPALRDRGYRVVSVSGLIDG